MVMTAPQFFCDVMWLERHKPFAACAHESANANFVNSELSIKFCWNCDPTELDFVILKAEWPFLHTDIIRRHEYNIAFCSGPNGIVYSDIELERKSGGPCGKTGSESDCGLSLNEYRVSYFASATKPRSALFTSWRSHSHMLDSSSYATYLLVACFIRVF